VSKITFRFARPGDIPALVQLRLALQAEAHPETPAPAGLAARLRKFFSAKIPAGEFLAAVAEVDGTLVAASGMIYQQLPPSVANPTGRAAYIMNVYVAPAFRRRGLATKLLKILVATARQARCRRVTLHAMPGARTLYAKLGFVARANEMKLEL
jgi:ribosomal protein S18 acetylase RimI-like enzyme